MTDPSTDPAFPPASLETFLRCCEGEWMSLRSRFDLEAAAAANAPESPPESAEAAGDEGAADGDEWHSSERGDLLVAYVEPVDGEGPGGLRVGPKGETPQLLQFSDDGQFRSGERQGQWTLWEDGSLELSLSNGARELRERIWFTKPNLRLRATLESSGDGSPSRASFSSEIRRVSRPPEPAG